MVTNMADVASLRAELKELKRQFLGRVQELEGRISALEQAEKAPLAKVLPAEPPEENEEERDGGEEREEEEEESDEAMLARLRAKPRSTLTEEEELELDILEEKEELKKIKQQKELFKLNQVRGVSFFCQRFSLVGRSKTGPSGAAKAAGRGYTARCSLERVAGKGQTSGAAGAVGAQGKPSASVRS